MSKDVGKVPIASYQPSKMANTEYENKNQRQ